MAHRAAPIPLSVAEARRLVLLGQALAGEPADTPVEVVERIGRVQIDPTALIDRAERLTLWSRLGTYDREELRRAQEEAPQTLFEYAGFIFPVADLPLHRPALRRYPRPEYARGRYVAEWLRDNADFRAYLLAELRQRGPLRSRDLDDRAEVPWRTGGWNDGRNLGRMLEILWRAGEIAIARREGNERVWDLAERVLPPEDEPLSDEVVAIELMDRQLRASGVVRPGWGSAVDYGLPAREVGEESLRADGIAVPVTIHGLDGPWLAHAELLAALDHEPPRRPTTLLGPFDPLIAHRERTAELFGFHYRLELYLPAARREYGPYAMPILDDERLIGRVDASLDRRSRTLRLHGVFAEPAVADSDAGERVAAAVAGLAGWLGAEAIELGPRIHVPWLASLEAAAVG